jgi:SAM-dependent methyltransferase
MKQWVKRSFPDLWTRARDRAYRVRTRTSLTGLKLRRSRFGLETARNVIVDLQYGGYCGGRIPARFAALGVHAASSTFYYELAEVFERTRGVSVRPDDVLVDVGCGKGRVMNFWLRNGLTNRMVGLEIDPDIAARTRRRLAPYPNISVVTGDALENIPPDGTLFFLFNPFERPMMEAFQRRVLAVVRQRRPLRIVYFSSRYIGAFSADAWNIQPLSLNTIQSAALITPR